MAPRVVIYTSEGCTLCERALEVVREVQAVVELDLEVVDIAGDEELERRYREQLPVVEVDGERVFVHFVDQEALRERLLR